jgi:hypothetical protein
MLRLRRDCRGQPIIVIHHRLRRWPSSGSDFGSSNSNLDQLESAFTLHESPSNAILEGSFPQRECRDTLAFARVNITKR